MEFYFPGFGTLVNVFAIISGGLIGLFGRKFLNEKIQQTLQSACAISVIFIGIGGTLEKMLIVRENSIKFDGTILLIVSLIVGGVIGETIDIDEKFNRLGIFLRNSFSNGDDSKFVDAFVTASLTVCIGAMAIIGAINDRLLHDPRILFAKSALDLIIILVMTSSLGKGSIFSFISVGIFQGAITLFAGFIEPFMTESALNNLSCVGNVLIFCVGVNLMFGNKIRVANLLPSVLIACIYK